MDLLKKKAENVAPLSLVCSAELLFNRCANRAVLCTVTAADAFVSVDNELIVTLGNARNGASVCACATVNAIVGNLVCHVKYLREFYG